MRSLILAAAVVALAAAAPATSHAEPATAAILGPVCTTRVVAVEPPASGSCSTANSPWGSSIRIMNVYVRNGVADATLTCGRFGNTRTTTRRIVAPERGTLQLNEHVGDTCTARLTAVADLTAAVATSHPAPRICCIDDPQG